MFGKNYSGDKNLKTSFFFEKFLILYFSCNSFENIDPTVFGFY